MTDEMGEAATAAAMQRTRDPRYQRGYLAGWYDAREHSVGRTWSWLLGLTGAAFVLWVPASLHVTGRLLGASWSDAQTWVLGGLFALLWALIAVWLIGGAMSRRVGKQRESSEAVLDEECREAEAAERRAAQEAEQVPQDATAERRAAKAARRAEKSEARSLLDSMEEAWPAILANVFGYSRLLWVTLDHSYPVSVRAGVVTVAVSGPTQAQSLEDPRHCAWLAKAIHDVTGHELVVEVESNAGEGHHHAADGVSSNPAAR